MKDSKWVIRSNQINEFPVMVQDIVVSLGQEHRCTEIKYHSAQEESSGQGLCESS
jgi:hypothetical protein